MHCELSATTVTVRAPAKVNLFLEVLGKRPDGYHEIATLMVAVNLYDTLEFKEETADTIHLHCDLPELGTGPDNLVCRAARLLQERTSHRGGATIRLTKRIPLAAGLAGGSSDAAATLAGLNQLWRLGLSQTELSELGAEIGSDISFFFATPAAWCTGRGEIVSPWPLGQPLDFVLVCPPVGLATAAVYRGVTVPEQPVDGGPLRQAVALGEVEAIGRGLHNRLQPVAERLCPVIAELAGRLAACRPAGQLMSGSGSALFALCRDAEEAQRIIRELYSPSGTTEKGPSSTGGNGLKLFLVRSCD